MQRRWFRHYLSLHVSDTQGKVQPAALGGREATAGATWTLSETTSLRLRDSKSSTGDEAGRRQHGQKIARAVTLA